MAARSFLYGGDPGGDAVTAGGGGSGFMLTNKRVLSSSKPLDSFFVSGSSHSFAGSRSMVSFEEKGNGSSGSFFRTFDHEENGELDEYDDYFNHQAEKKRRLKADQVQFLEKSFETENKLEPERKIELAKELGLQPRQIAIWFQNRRARWKTKQLEKDYDLLQESYNQLKANYENLLQEKEKLKSEVLDLSDKLLRQETEKGRSSSEPLQHEHVADCLNDEVITMTTNGGVKRVASESSSPRYVDGIQSLLEHGDSSCLFEQDQSDESVDEEDTFGKMLVNGYMMPKIENCYYPEVDGVKSCYVGFSGHDDQDDIEGQSFGFWSY